jgi:hypothetical protein
VVRVDLELVLGAVEIDAEGADCEDSGKQLSTMGSICLLARVVCPRGCGNNVLLQKVIKLTQDRGEALDRPVTSDNERAIHISSAEGIAGFTEGLLEVFPGSGVRRGPMPGNPFLEKVIERRGLDRKRAAKTSVVVGHSASSAKRGNVMWVLEAEDGHDLSLVGRDTIGGDVKAQVLKNAGSKDGLARMNLHSHLQESSKDSIQVPHMILKGVAVDEEIIKIGLHKGTEVIVTDDSLHIGLEPGRRVDEAKGDTGVAPTGGGSIGTVVGVVRGARGSKSRWAGPPPEGSVVTKVLRDMEVKEALAHV